MRTSSAKFWRYSVVVAVACTVVAVAHASAADGILDTASEKYKAATGLWQAVMVKYGTRLFGLLAAIELTWLGIQLALKGADLQEIVGEFVRLILIFGFFLALIQFGAVWMPAIVDSFVQIGNEANAAAGGAAAYTPSTIVDSGLFMAAHMCDSASLLLMPVAGIWGLVILAAATFIGCLMLVALVEMYVVTSIGMLFFGFGASRWTRDYAIKILTYAVSVGVKLMLIQLIVGLGSTFMKQFVDACSTNEFNIDDAAGAVVALGCVAYLAKVIPSTVQSLISGVDAHGGGAMSFMAGAVSGGKAASTAIAAATGGTGAAVMAAAKLTAAQNASAGSTGAGGSTGGSGSTGSAGGGDGGSGGGVGAAASLAKSTASAAKTSSGGSAGKSAGSTGGSATKTASAGSAKPQAGATSARAASSSLGLGSKVKAGVGFGLQTAGNLFKAAATDMGNRLAGDLKSAHGVAGFRMARAMNEQAAELKSATSSSQESNDKPSDQTSAPQKTDRDSPDNTDANKGGGATT